MTSPTGARAVPGRTRGVFREIFGPNIDFTNRAATCGILIAADHLAENA
jgi:hypothetical protein